jgi:hypothetical protein
MNGILIIDGIGARAYTTRFFEQWETPIIGTIVQKTGTHALFVPDEPYRSEDGAPIQPWIPWADLELIDA